MLEPLLQDLKDDGAFVPSLGKVVKGTVPVVVADNLAAPLIGGFVESFSSSHFCRFCIGERSQTGLPTVPQNTGLLCGQEVSLI